MDTGKLTFSEWKHPTSGALRVYVDNHGLNGTDAKIWVEQHGQPEDDSWKVRVSQHYPRDADRVMTFCRELAQELVGIGATWSNFVGAKRKEFGEIAKEAKPNADDSLLGDQIPEFTPEQEASFKAMSRNALLNYISTNGYAAGPILWSAKRHDLLALLIEKTPLPASGSTTATGTTTREEIQKVARETVADLLERAVTDEMEKQGIKPNPRPIVIRVANKPEVTFTDMRHEKFEEVLRTVAADVPVMLVGPAGSGKTRLAAQIAKALGQPFSFNSMSSGVTESSLLGRVLPTDSGAWEYKPAPFVTAFESGGIHLFDELDAADPNLLVQINAAIANRVLSIPFAGRMVDRHAATRIISAANTFGQGADRQYAGRNQLDEATLDRFRMGIIEIKYDRSLEAGIVGQLLELSDCERLLNWAWRVRERLEQYKMRRLCSTRTLENMSLLMQAGFTFEQAVDRYFSGWTADEVNKVR